MKEEELEEDFASRRTTCERTSGREATGGSEASGRAESGDGSDASTGCEATESREATGSREANDDREGVSRKGIHGRETGASPQDGRAKIDHYTRGRRWRHGNQGGGTRREGQDDHRAAEDQNAA